MTAANPTPAGVATEELDAARGFTVFTGNVELDPHRVGLWAVWVDVEGLTLERAEVTPRDRETGHASWAELHAMLGERAALADDLQQLRDEVREEEEALVRLRVEARRLRVLAGGVE